MTDFLNKPELRRLWDLMKEYVGKKTFTRGELVDMGLIQPTSVDGKSDKTEVYTREEVDNLLSEYMVAQSISSEYDEVESISAEELWDILK